MSGSLDDAAWTATPPGALPERFDQRRAWLLERVSPGERVLDIGAGRGEFARALTEAGAEVVAVDPSAVAAGQSEGRVEHLARRPIPFGDSSFDVVWAGEVIEHVADTSAFLSEVRRVLRAEGRLLLSTPWHGRLKTAALALTAHERALDPAGPHLRFFTGRGLRSVLEDLAFDEIRLSALGGVPCFRATLLAEAVRPRTRLAVRGSSGAPPPGRPSGA